MAVGEDDTDESTDGAEIRTGSIVTQSLPHTYGRQDLSVEIDEVRLDGNEIGERGEIDRDDQFLSVVDAPAWATLEIQGTVEVEFETIREIFPPEEYDDPPGRLALVKTNRLAISRSRNILVEAPLEEGEHEFEIRIARDDFRGTVTVEPYVVRSASREKGASNCATKVGSRIADGEPWMVRLDDPSDGGGLLMPIIEDFGDTDRLPDDNHIHYLSLDEPRNPQLYLNRGHPQVVNVLKNEGGRGGSPRLRDLLYDYIEHSVWTQLLLQTARDADPDTGETAHHWQDDVVEIFNDDLYPKLDQQMTAVQIAEDIRNMEDLPALVGKIERAVHQRYDIPTDTTKLIEEAIQNGN
jgi:hypothetical protein